MNVIPNSLESGQGLQSESAAGPVKAHTGATNAKSAAWGCIPIALRQRAQWCFTSGDSKVPLTLSPFGGSVAADPTFIGNLLSFEEACEEAERRNGHIGYVIDESDPFTCVDFDVKDDTPENWIAGFKAITAELDSYTETSCSGRGWHVWTTGDVGAGRRRHGVEVYSRQRFMICTGNAGDSPAPIQERQAVLDALVARMGDAPIEVEPVKDQPATESDEQVLARARSAYNADKFNTLWEGRKERAGEGDHSQSDASLIQMLCFYTPSNEQVKRLFLQSGLGHRLVQPPPKSGPVRAKAKPKKYLEATVQFARNKQAEDVAKSKVNLVDLTPFLQSQSAKQTIKLEPATVSNTEAVSLEFLLDPFLPRKGVVCFAGRGGTAKSSFLSTLAVSISARASTLWISTEEKKEWVNTRHIKSGGWENTLFYFCGLENEKSLDGTLNGTLVPVVTFNVYDHLEQTILAGQSTALRLNGNRQPLRLVTLDTAVALTLWEGKDTPNSDESVKKLLAFLEKIASKYDVTIAFVTHANKGKHDHIADTVSGSSAWVNSPRQSFVHSASRFTENHFVMRSVKQNQSAPFGVSYRTVPVHTLYKRQGTNDSVLCRAEIDPVVWGNIQLNEMYEAEGLGNTTGGGAPVDGRRKDPTGTQVHRAISMVLEMVRMSDQPFERAEVHARMQEELANREWSKVDKTLECLPHSLEVRIERGSGKGGPKVYRSAKGAEAQEESENE